jgi:2-oxoglutarate dehydrogenase E1 component
LADPKDKHASNKFIKIQVCNPSYSANYFHLLRRQLKRNFRKPLIVSSPKKLLRFVQAGSSIEDFNEGLGYTKVRLESLESVKKNAQNVKKVLICSGQVYYDLIAERQKLKSEDVAIITLEQIAPFPYKELYEAIKPYSNAQITWTQEEHMNQGCWGYVEPRINNLLKKGGIKSNRVSYVGRNPSSASATGHQLTHDKELHSLLKDAFKKI